MPNTELEPLPKSLAVSERTDNLLEFFECIGLRVRALVYANEWCIRWELTDEGDREALRSLNAIRGLMLGWHDLIWGGVSLYSDAYPGQIVGNDIRTLHWTIEQALNGNSEATQLLAAGPRAVLAQPKRIEYTR